MASIQAFSGTSNAVAAALAAAAFAASSGASAAMLGAASVQSATVPKSLADWLASGSASTLANLGTSSSLPLLYKANGLLDSPSWLDTIIGSTTPAAFEPWLPTSAADRLQSDLALVLGRDVNAGGGVRTATLNSPSPATAATVAGVLANSASTVGAAEQKQALNDLLAAVMQASASTSPDVSASPGRHPATGVVDTPGSQSALDVPSRQELARALSETLRANPVADVSTAPQTLTLASPVVASTRKFMANASQAETPAVRAWAQLATSARPATPSATATGTTVATAAAVDAIDMRLQNLRVTAPTRAVHSVATDPIRAAAIAAFQVNAAFQRLSTDDAGGAEAPESVRATPLSPVERIQAVRAL
ncbi:hypothetical protein [Rhodocyclus tenuis]|uniref:hypothetical protein n=1 Tax=Rhodocyclus tenuis TaxID=1066 RepID=UPI001A919C44|nr:hypothetical protein [Rhodocyclus tenuis]